MSETPDNLLICHTAKYKLKESQYWLECMKKHEIFLDDEIVGFLLKCIFEYFVFYS